MKIFIQVIGILSSKFPFYGTNCATLTHAEWYLTSTSDILISVVKYNLRHVSTSNLASDTFVLILQI